MPAFKFSVVPELIDALVAKAQSVLPDDDVIDGPDGRSSVRPRCLLIGVDDPDSNDDLGAADVDQDWHDFGAGQVKEEGDVTCVAQAWSGDTDMQPLRENVFDMLNTFALALRADKQLGVDGLIWVRPSSRVHYSQSLFTDDDDQVGGAVATVQFQLHFKAYI